MATTAPSSTWAASVPMNLTEAIAAAVGPQPVPQLPPKQLFPAATQQHQRAGQQLQLQQHAQPVQQQQEAWDIVASTVDAYPVRWPTAADARAASPPAADGLQHELLLQQAMPAQALYDDMDNLQLQDSSMQQDTVCSGISDAVAVASLHAPVSKAADLQATQLSQQEQQQLLSQLWDELQASQQASAASAQVPEGCCKLDLQFKPVVHLHATNSGHLSTGASLQSSSSCCSSEQAAAASLAAAALAAAAAATAADPSAVPESPCSSGSGRALSSCSTSSSKKRVSWGDPVVHHLPPEQPTPLLMSLWHSVCDWWAPEDAEWHSSSRTWSPAATAATTAVVSVAAAAAVAACVAHRVHRS